MENASGGIGRLSIITSVERQTPRNDFGTVLARSAQEAVRVGTGLVESLAPGNPLVSAAVSSVRSAVSAAASVAGASPVSAGGGAGSPGAAEGTAGRGDAWDMLEAQRALSVEGQKFNMAYLQLQNELQRESREHNAISNIMKVRHDSAKAAINNIR